MTFNIDSTSLIIPSSFDDNINYGTSIHINKTNNKTNNKIWHNIKTTHFSVPKICINILVYTAYAFMIIMVLTIIASIIYASIKR
jgi:hypothetical protein